MADDDDDDDMGALDGDAAEPATAAEHVATGGPVTQVITPRRGARPISDTVRKVFQQSMEKLKAKGGSASDDDGIGEPLGAEDETPPPTVEASAPVAAAPVETPVAVPPVAPVPAPVAPVAAVPAPVATPPAPSLDPEVVRIRTELEQQRSDFEAEKAKWFEQSKASDVAKLRDMYFDKGAPALVEIVKQWRPDLTPEEIKDEVADLIQDFAHQYLEAPLDPTVKDRITNKRTRAGMKAWKAEQQRAEEERQKQLAASAEEQNRVHVKRILHQEVTKPEHQSQYPWLVSETNAGDLVYETIDQEFRKSGTQLTWQDAAKRVDDWLKSQALAYFDKRKHLLSPPPQQPAAPAEAQRPQGDTQVRRSQAPPKPQDKPAEPPKAVVKDGKWSADMHRRNTMQKFRGQLKALTDEE